MDNYALSTAKVAVDNYAVFGTYSLIKIRNNNFDTLTTDAVNINGEDCNDSSLPVSLGIGEMYVLNCSVTFEGIPDINIIWTDSSTGASYSTGENATSGSSGGGSPAAPWVSESESEDMGVESSSS